MTDFKTQRTNMVDSQLRTNQVTDQRILRAMMDIPREEFVPEEKKGFAYMDQDILVGRDQDGRDRYMMSPMTISKLVQLASVDDKDIVLIVGCTTGYLAAILASLADSIVCLESDPKLVETATLNLEKLGCDNAATVEGSLLNGYSKEAPYDIIIFNGSVGKVPAVLFDQVKDNGRLVAVQQLKGTVGRAHLYHKIGDRVGESRASFDVFAQPLPEFEEEEAFAF